MNILLAKNSVTNKYWDGSKFIASRAEAQPVDAPTFAVLSYTYENTTAEKVDESIRWGKSDPDGFHVEIEASRIYRTDGVQKFSLGVRLPDSGCMNFTPAMTRDQVIRYCTAILSQI